MEQVHVIRHKVLIEGQSQRRVAREMGLSRNTVKKYLEVSEPKRLELNPRSRPVLEEVKPRMDQLLEEWAGRVTAKQRLTGCRLHRELVQEGYLRQSLTGGSPRGSPPWSATTCSSHASPEWERGTIREEWRAGATRSACSI